jgi:hypothetical protein
MQNKTIFTSVYKQAKLEDFISPRNKTTNDFRFFFFEKCFSNSLLSSYLINKQINKVTFLNTV